MTQSNTHLAMTRVIAAVLSFWVVGCGISSQPPAGPVVSARCGNATIEPTARVFATAFDIAFNVVVEESSARLCTTHPAYTDTEPGTETVVLYPVQSAHGDREALSSPLWFVETSPEKLQPLPEFSFAAEWELKNQVGTVPAGEYRLVLRYTLAPCRDRLFDSVCIAVSEPFTVEEPIKFVRER